MRSPWPRQRRLRVEGQKRIEHRKRPLGHAKQRPALADRPEHLPFVHDDAVRTFFSRSFDFATMASENGRRPKGVVEICSIFPCVVQAKEKRAPNRR